MSKEPRFFRHADFEFMTEIVLGASAYRAAEAGEVLATAGRIKDGDYGSWVGEWEATADRVRAAATTSEDAGHRVSAREAYLRASMLMLAPPWWVSANDATITAQHRAAVPALAPWALVST